MGVVFRARDTKLDRDVAVKVVTGAGIDAHACERLLREVTGDDALAVISQHINARVVPPRTRAPDLPAELDAVITRLLAKDPTERFGSAADLDAALSALTATDDTVDTLQFRAATSKHSNRSEPTHRINRRLTGASQLPPMYGREKFLETVANAVR